MHLQRTCAWGLVCVRDATSAYTSEDRWVGLRNTRRQNARQEVRAPAAPSTRPSFSTWLPARGWECPQCPHSGCCCACFPCAGAPLPLSSWLASAQQGVPMTRLLPELLAEGPWLMLQSTHNTHTHTHAHTTHTSRVGSTWQLSPAWAILHLHAAVCTAPSTPPLHRRRRQPLHQPLLCFRTARGGGGVLSTC